MDSAAWIELDLTGLSCPHLVLRLADHLRGAAPGSRYRVLASDPLSRIDIPYYLHRRGHALLEQGRQGEWLVFAIRTGGDSPEEG